MKNCLYCKNRGVDHICKACVAWNRYEDIVYNIVTENTMRSRRRPDKDLYLISTSMNMAFGSGLCIKKVIFNDPATIVIWTDGSKTVIKCDGEEKYDPEKGLAMAICKKALGNKGNYYEVFKKWLPDEESNTDKDESNEIS